MKKIKSFAINHDNHNIGFYLSNEMNDIYTYDMRFKKPNMNEYLSNSALHTIEHIFATVIRNGEYSNDVVYFGPMGCRTGFYLLLRRIDYSLARTIVIDTLNKCLEFESIPGSERTECGNYLEHNLEEALVEINSYLEAITS